MGINDETELQCGMRLIPRCEDPELSLLERASDGILAILAALFQAVLAVILIPVWIAVGVFMGLQEWLSRTYQGERVGKRMGGWFLSLSEIFEGVLTLPSDGATLSAARQALADRKAEELSRALMKRGFMGLRAVRPKDKVALLISALRESELSFEMCDVIVGAGCRVCGFWPNKDVLFFLSRAGCEIKKLRWVLSHGAHPGSNRTVLSRSIVEEAIQVGSLEAVKIFEQTHPMGIWGKRRAVRLTAALRVDAILEWMLSQPDWQKAVNMELKCRTRPTLLMEAASGFECVKILLPRSRPNQASYSDELALFRLCKGRLFLRVGAGARALVKYQTERNLEGVKALREAGGDIWGSNCQGETLLHHAAGQIRDDTMILWLLAQGLDPLAQDDQGETPLMWAARKESETNLQALLNVSNIHATNKKGQSVLMILASSEEPNYFGLNTQRMACGETLIAAGSDPQLRDKKGLRAVDMAARTAKPELFNMLSLRSSWEPDAVEKILDSRAVREMKRPKEVAEIRATANRLREVVEIETVAAAPVTPAVAKPRRL